MAFNQGWIDIGVDAAAFTMESAGKWWDTGFERGVIRTRVHLTITADRVGSDGAVEVLSAIRTAPTCHRRTQVEQVRASIVRSHP